MAARLALRTLALATSAALCAGLGAVAATPAVAEDAERYIVQLQPGVDVRDFARGLAGPRATSVFEAALNGLAVQGSPAQFERLRRDPRVLRLTPDGVAQVAAKPSGSTGPWVPAPDMPWGLDRIDQAALPLASSYAPAQSGAGVSVYVVDTGVNPHEQFQDRLRPGVSTVSDGNGTRDCHGHGSHVAGTAAGLTVGVAQEALVVPVRVLDCSGFGSWSQIIAGLDWVLANAVRPAVVNISIQGEANAAVDQAVQELVAADIPVVAAAGNSGVDACSVSPGRSASALTIGATNAGDARAAWSNFGTCIDLFAPGENIISVDSASTTGLTTRSGTSMAAPHVTGLAALALSTSPTRSASVVNRDLVAEALRDVVLDVSGSVNLLAHTSPTSDGPPTAVISAACLATTCTFTADGSHDDDRIAAWSWGSSDGTTASLSSMTRTFVRGTHQVALRVTDSAWQSSSTQVTVTCERDRALRMLACSAS